MNQATGLTWLDSKKWSDVTRDERFFCAILYEHARKDPADFAQWLIQKAALNVPASGPWDIGFEVCFYRDYLWLKGLGVKAERFPPKRTFDLCLFSEHAIIIIEAKVCEAFDLAQNQDFKNDKKRIRELPGLENIEVCTVPLASAKYFENGRQETLVVFDNKRLTWAMVAEKYGDPLLRRADGMYKLKKGQLSGN